MGKRTTTNCELGTGFEGGSNSVVESQPSKLLVAGSNPVSRSIVWVLAFVRVEEDV